VIWPRQECMYSTCMPLKRTSVGIMCNTVLDVGLIVNCDLFAWSDWNIYLVFYMIRTFAVGSVVGVDVDVQ